MISHCTESSMVRWPYPIYHVLTIDNHCMMVSEGSDIGSFDQYLLGSLPLRKAINGQDCVIESYAPWHPPNMKDEALERHLWEVGRIVTWRFPEMGVRSCKSIQIIQICIGCSILNPAIGVPPAMRKPPAIGHGVKTHLLSQMEDRERYAVRPDPQMFHRPQRKPWISMVGRCWKMLEP